MYTPYLQAKKILDNRHEAKTSYFFNIRPSGLLLIRKSGFHHCYRKDEPYHLYYCSSLSTAQLLQYSQHVVSSSSAINDQTTDEALPRNEEAHTAGVLSREMANGFLIALISKCGVAAEFPDGSLV
jgi:hypothetical protein